jgi:uncharacterized membrane protein
MKRDKLGLDRILFFSDAVFAIAITLLALDLKLPAHAGAQAFSKDLIHLWPEYQSYVTSFLAIGLYWISHHHYFRFIRRYNYTLVGLNITLLMCISFIPFATSVLDDYHGQRAAVAFYAACIALTGLLKTALWHYAAHQHRLIHRYLSRQRIQRLTWQALIPPIVFGVSIGIALFNSSLAELSWFSIVPLLLILWSVKSRRFT